MRTNYYPSRGFLSVSAFASSVLLCLGLFSGLAAFAQDAGAVANIELKGIKSVQIKNPDGNFIAEVVVLFSNANKQSVRLDNGKFNIVLTGVEFVKVVDPATGVEKLVEKVVRAELGTGVIHGEVLPGVTEVAQGGAKDVRISFLMGRASSSDTQSRLLTLVNLLGNPASKKTLTLRGESDFASAVPRGWVTQRSILVELDYKPKLQNSVLFE